MSRKFYYENIVFLDGDDAVEPLAILGDKGCLAAMEYTKQWDCEGCDSNLGEPWGTSDDTFTKGRHTLSWNDGLGYIALCRKMTRAEEDELYGGDR